MVIRVISVSKWIESRVSITNIAKSGFIGFFKLHRNYYWTKQFPYGIKLERFLSLISEKSIPERIPKSLLFPWHYLSMAIGLVLGVIGVIVLPGFRPTVQGIWWLKITANSDHIITVSMDVDEKNRISGRGIEIKYYERKPDPFGEDNCYLLPRTVGWIYLTGHYETGKFFIDNISPGSAYEYIHIEDRYCDVRFFKHYEYDRYVIGDDRSGPAWTASHILDWVPFNQGVCSIKAKDLSTSVCVFFYQLTLHQGKVEPELSLEMK